MASSIELAPEYVWAFPGAPVRIHLRFAVIARLREHLVRKSGVLGGPSGESGGLLLGESRPGHVEITDFQIFEPDREGRTFILSDSEKARLQRAIQAHGKAVVGYFRTDLREGIRLSKDDLNVIQDLFRNPSQVFLVMRLEEEVAPTAGFFFWENGAIFADATFMQFPLDERMLDAAPVPKRNPEPKPEAPPAVSHQPVNYQPVTYQQVAHRAPGPDTHTIQIPWPLLMVAVICALAGYAIYLGFQRETPKQAEAEAGPTSVSSSLALSASRVQKDLAIVWSSNLAAVSEARIGMLTIRDGETQTELPLTRAQLQMNKLIYVPRSDRLELTLEVFAADGKPTRESVMVAFAQAQSSKPVARTETRPVSEFVPLEKAAPARTFTVIPITTSNLAGRLPEHTVLEAPPAAKVTTFDPVTSKTPEFLLPAAVQPGTAPKSVELTPRTITIEPARALRQVKPVLPPNIGAMLKRRIDVEVRVFIDATGKVTKTESLVSSSGISRYLGTIAANAVRMWTFQPAREGNTPVSSDLVVRLAFGPN